MTRRKADFSRRAADPVEPPSGRIGHLYLGLDGAPIERTPRTHPYSYDDHYFFHRHSEGPTNTVWSDRLATQERQKLDAARAKFPHCWSMSDVDVEQAEGALSMIFGRKIEIVSVIASCNRSSGYPLWAFVVKEEPA